MPDPKGFGQSEQGMRPTALRHTYSRLERKRLAKQWSVEFSYASPDGEWPPPPVLGRC